MALLCRVDMQLDNKSQTRRLYADISWTWPQCNRLQYLLVDDILLRGYLFTCLLRTLTRRSFDPTICFLSLHW